MSGPPHDTTQSSNLVLVEDEGNLEPRLRRQLPDALSLPGITGIERGGEDAFVADPVPTAVT